MTESLFAPDFSETPYWWDRTPRPELEQGPPPATCDVAIVGSGYSGLAAALQTARGGRQTLVLDAGDAGRGCSTRNGGQIGTSIKPSFEELARRHGSERARAILGEGLASLEWIGDFIAAEAIDCDFKRVGRFHAAHTPAQYEALVKRLEAQPKGLEVEAHLVPRDQQRGELGTDIYYGGAVFPRHASLDPGRFHQGLLTRAQAAGATVAAHCPVEAIVRDGKEFRLVTKRGPVTAREVVVATNGYSGALVPWLRRRVIPIGSYMIATEPLPPGLLDRLMPKNRVLSDSRKLVFYYRASPDRTRILFGGRVSLKETDPRASAPRLHAELAQIFPELAGTRISRSWMGFVAYTFDTLPHIGRHDGLHFSMGYCGSGVGMASYLGTRLGQQVLGLAEGRSALSEPSFQTRPFYRGDPWFLAPSIHYYRWRDRQNR